MHNMLKGKANPFRLAETKFDTGHKEGWAANTGYTVSKISQQIFHFSEGAMQRYKVYTKYENHTGEIPLCCSGIFL